MQTYIYKLIISTVAVNADISVYAIHTSTTYTPRSQVVVVVVSLYHTCESYFLFI